jgi:hypothetical protein
LLDIPSHSRAFFPTPFLWPLSKVTFDGVDWTTPRVMVANYVALAIVYALLVLSSILT